MFGVWRLEWNSDCEKLLHSAAAAVDVAAQEASTSSWMDFLTMSKHSEINNSAVDDHHSHVVCPEYGLGTAAFFFNECAKPESVSENSSGVGDLNLLIVDHVNIIQSQEGAQQVTTRHYVRRRRDGDGPAAAGTARVQSDCTNADLNAARQFSVGKVCNGFPRRLPTSMMTETMKP